MRGGYREGVVWLWVVDELSGGGGGWMVLGEV